MTDPVVRAARVDDAEAIGRVHVRCWRHAYADLVPADLLAGLDEERRGAQWRERLAEPGPGAGSTLVLEAAGGELLGFANVGGVQHADGSDPALTGELRAIYLAPEAIGTGVGRVLLEAATQQLRDEGFTSARLDVLPGNDRARRVYEAAGWLAIGEQWIEHHGGHDLPHQRYRRDL